MQPQLQTLGAQFENSPDLALVIALMKERVNTTIELAEAAMLFYREPNASAELRQQHITANVIPALQDYAEACKTIEWNKAALSGMLKEVLAKHALKMPQLAMPLRLLLTGQLQTPSIDAVVELLGRELVLQRLAKLAA